MGSPDGRRRVYGSYDQAVRVWDVEKGQEALVRELSASTVPFSVDSFREKLLADGKRLVTGSYDQTWKVWDVEKGQEALALKGDAGTVASVAFSPDGKRIFAWDVQNKALAWSAADGKPIAPVHPPPAARPGHARSPAGFRHAVG